jgi:hypothetical protein
MAAMAISIIAYSKIRCSYPGFVDPIGKFPFGGQNSKYATVLDGWSISHFTFFFVLGLCFPGQMYAAMTYGLLWEGVEFLTQHTDSHLVDMLRGVSTCKNSSMKDGDHYFYGKSTDIILNLTGFLIGSGIITVVHKLKT